MTSEFVQRVIKDDNPYLLSFIKEHSIGSAQELFTKLRQRKAELERTIGYDLDKNGKRFQELNDIGDVLTRWKELFKEARSQ